MIKQYKQGTEKWYQQEWQNMPEFIQENKQPIQKIIVSFANREDVKKFGLLTGYKLTPKTKSIWFPFRQKDCMRTKGYVNEA